jgi:hypothetical protein
MEVERREDMLDQPDAEGHGANTVEQPDLSSRRRIGPDPV